MGIQVQGNSGTYEINQHGDGSFSCSCPAWRFTRNGAPANRRTCKHIESLAIAVASHHLRAKGKSLSAA